jgi:predicted N-formylglutamate amidohydrolase
METALIAGDSCTEGRHDGVMTQAWLDIPTVGTSGLLLVADHASNHVPDDVDLGVSPDLLERHIAWDIGVAPLAVSLCTMLHCPGILGGVSRLVVDFNRDEEDDHLVPVASDGHAIPGNRIGPLERAERIDRFWRPYHQHVSRRIAECRPLLLISLHSFTPKLETRQDVERPWDVGILYNNDDRAARVAIDVLATIGVSVGDQLPYSGKQLNATMNRHGEANGIAYLGIEMRQDQIGDQRGVDRWAGILAPVIEKCSTSLASGLGGDDAHA